MKRKHDPIATLAASWKATGLVPPHALVMSYAPSSERNDLEAPWVEPLPTCQQQHDTWNGVTMSYGKESLDAHNLLGWYEKRRSEDGSGYFLLCRGLIFNAKDESAAVAAVTAAAARNAAPSSVLSEHELPAVEVFNGALSRAALRRLVGGADAFALPSRGEGWGLPIAEASECPLSTLLVVYSATICPVVLMTR